MSELVHDPNKHAIGRLKGYDIEMPDISKETVVEERIGNCAEDCFFATRCNHAKENAKKDHIDTVNAVYNFLIEPPDPPPHKQRRERLTAIADFENEIETCQGPIIQTVETTYTPFPYADAGKLQRWVMRLMGKHTAVAHRDGIVCSNPAAPAVVASGVSFRNNSNCL